LIIKKVYMYTIIIKYISLKKIKPAGLKINYCCVCVEGSIWKKSREKKIIVLFYEIF
jgi:hypothetical protein